MAPVGPLSIRLTEPITFLRGSATGQDFRGRQMLAASDAPPAMLRGLLTLKVLKPTRIRKIEITLRGVTRTEWPEGIGPRRIETSEEHVLIEDSAIFFAASASHSRSRDRRAVSLGPGSRYEEDLDEQEDEDGDWDEDGDDDVGPGDGWQAPEGRGRAMGRAGPGRSYSVATESLATGTIYSQPSTRRQSFDRPPESTEESPSTLPDLQPVPRIGRDRSHMQSQRGPSPAYSPIDPLKVGRQRAASSLRSQRMPTLDLNDTADPRETLLTPIESASASAETSEASQPNSQDESESPVAGASTLGPVSNGSGLPRRFHRARIASIAGSRADHVQNALDDAPPREQESSRTPEMFTNSNSTLTSLASSQSSSASLRSEPGITTPPARSSPQLQPRSTRPTLPIDDDDFITVTRRGSRQSELFEVVPSPKASPRTSPRLGPVDGRRSNVMSPGGSSRASSLRSSRVAATPPQSASASTTSVTRPGQTSAAPAPQIDRGRKAGKFSFSSVFRGLSQDVKERVTQRAASRTPSNTGTLRREISDNGSTTTLPAQGRSSSAYGAHPPYGRGGAQREVSRTRRTESPAGSRDERSESRGRGRGTGFKALTGGAGRDESVDGHNWKEFRKGTYNYPISFAIPANTPPTIHADFGSVVYRLRATVVRVGALSPNYFEELEVVMVASPQEDDMEETENIVVERQWEDQMRYLIALSGKAFPIGGSIPMSIRMMPMSKCKIYRLSATIEEKVDYFALDKKVARHEAVKKYVLLSIKKGDKVASPILPIISDAPDAVQTSPLAEMAVQALAESEGLDDAAAALLNPNGPWNLESTLQVPDCASRIRFSTKHAKTNMAISHYLKVVIRVERGDDAAMDVRGKRKQFDIIIETPVHLLDCRVNTQWNFLPTYTNASTSALAGMNPVACKVHGSRQTLGHVQLGNPSTPSTLVAQPSTNSSALGSPSLRGRIPVDRRGSETSPVGTDTPDTLLERNIVFDRLVSGQESEAGEAPPAYNDTLGVRGTSNSRSRSRARGAGSRSRSRMGVDRNMETLMI